MITFSMQKIDRRQFAVVSEGTAFKDLRNIEFKLNFVPLPDEHGIYVKTRFEFIGPDGAVAAVAEVGCLFSIKAEDWAAEIGDGDGAAVPKWILDLFAFHTVGTARGLIYDSAEDTSLRGLIIPPIDVDSMIKSDLSVKTGKPLPSEK